MEDDEAYRLHQAVVDFLGEVPMEVLCYPTGAVAITLRHNTRTAVIDGMADRSQWGVTVIGDTEYFLPGYDQVFEDLHEALQYLREVL
jgi:hypothetical protein